MNVVFVIDSHFDTVIFLCYLILQI